MRKTTCILTSALLALAACAEDEVPAVDPYHCEADDIDGDGDGRCNE